MVALAPSHTAQLGNYTTWLEKNNFPYKILRPGDSLVGFSVLILCGGPDVGKPGVEMRDLAEKDWLNQAYGKIAVLGICRGLQLTNVFLGGTLHVDLSEQPIKHSANKISISGEPNPLLESSFHDVVFDDGKKIKVNSRHHQAIKDLAPGLQPIAKADGDDVFEMVEGNNALFVQWHPEREDVWGTDAEKIVSDWLRTRVNISEEKIDTLRLLFDKIVNYLYTKGFTTVSRERIIKSIDSSVTNTKLDDLVASYPLKNVIDKNGKPAIRLLSNWRHVINC